MVSFGALVATVLVRVPQSSLFDVTVTGNLGTLGVRGGWVLFALGVLLIAIALGMLVAAATVGPTRRGL